MIVPFADLLFSQRTLQSFVQAVALVRAIPETDGLKNVWIVARGAAFETAVIDWCILFGSHSPTNQQIHWKNMFNVEEFREGLHKALPISPDEWARYRADMLSYRDGNAAHRDLNTRATHFPNFGSALEAGYFYWDRLVEKSAYQGIRFHGPSMREHYETCAADFGAQVAVAIKAVK